MRLVPRSSGLLLLSVAALTLAVAFSLWSIALALSIAGLRESVVTNVGALLALDGLRDQVLDLERFVDEPPEDLAAPGLGAEWRRRYAAAASSLGEITGVEGAAAGHVATARAAMSAMDETAFAVLTGPASGEAKRAFHQAHRAAQGALADAIRGVRVDQRAVSTVLDVRWRLLYLLAALSTLTVFVLAFVLWLARLEAARHVAAERRIRRSEDRFRSVLSALPDLILVLGADGTYRSIFTADGDLLYQPADEILGRSIHDVFCTDVAAEFQEVIDRALETGEAQSYDYPLETAGEERWFSARVVPFGGDEDAAVLWVARNMTAQKRAAEELSESEARFRQLAENIDEVVSLATWTEGGVEYVSPAYETMFGRSCQSLYDDPSSWQELIHPDDRSRVLESFKHARNGTYDEEFRIIRDDGTMRWVRDRAFAIRDDKGKVYRIAGLTHDVTKRRQMEDALGESEQRFRRAFERTAVSKVLVDVDGRFIRANDAFCELLGRDADEIPQLTFEMVTHPDDLAASRAGAAALISGECSEFTLEKRYLRKDGSEIWCLTSVTAITGADGTPQYHVAEVQDINERKNFEQKLQQTNAELDRRVRQRTADLETANTLLTLENAERTRAERIQATRNRVLQRLASGASLEEVLNLLVETIEEVHPKTLGSILLLDESGTRLRLAAAPNLPDFYNEAVDGLEIGPHAGSCGAAAYSRRRVIVEDIMTHENWTPYREIAGRAGLRACWSEPIFSSANEILGTFAIYYAEPRAPTDADLEFIKSTAHLAGIAIERRKAEAELRETYARLRVADRLASLGTLTAGLGHDMSNVLFPIRCRIDALDSQTLPPDVRELLGSTRDTVDYLQQLARGLRLLATDTQDGEDESGITASVEAWWERVRPLITKMVPDSVSIETVIAPDLPAANVAPHHLTQAVLNLVINAAEAMPDGGCVRIRAWSDDSEPWVRISITDEGAGMTDEVRQRIFDPFFTTKTRSLSTGLGLSVVHTRVRLSKGTVTVSSAPGEGTTFLLSFPVAGAATTILGANGNGNGRAAVSLRDKRTAAWVSSVLRSAGYEVRPADDGDPQDSSLWVTEPTPEHLRTARRLAEAADHRVIVLGRAGTDWKKSGAVVVEDVGNLEAIRSAVREVTHVSP